MIVKDGFNNQELELRIGNGNKNSRKAELWINEKGKIDDRETLSYITLLELLELKDEIDKVIGTITGIKGDF